MTQVASADLSTISRQMQLSAACFSSSDILSAALQLFYKNYIFQPKKALRNVGIRRI
ncbi:DinB/UmuC family translesion DNA polymerase [Phascolarctobacterium sp.]